MQERPGPAAAADLARELLAPLGARWAHTQQVAHRADDLARAVPEQDHDLGYAPELVQTGFRPIDGARYLAARGHSPRLCAPVAHHSAATFEAEERDLTAELADWPREEGPVPDALSMADMTTGPRGQPFDYTDRLAEILARYEPDSIVGRAMTRAQPDISAAIERTTARLTAAACTSPSS